MLTRTTTALLAGATALGLHLVAAPPAHAAAYGCSGSLVGSWRIPMKDQLDGGTYYISDIKLFYNPATGWNCAALAKRPGHQRYGKKTPLYIEMYNARYAEDAVKNNYDSDRGSYKYYAGPVKVYGRNMCVSIRAMHGDHVGGDTDYNGRRHVSGVACR